jgi:hypothetical protein
MYSFKPSIIPPIALANLALYNLFSEVMYVCGGAGPLNHARNEMEGLLVHHIPQGRPGAAPSQLLSSSYHSICPDPQRPGITEQGKGIRCDGKEARGTDLSSVGREKLYTLSPRLFECKLHGNGYKIQAG